MAYKYSDVFAHTTMSVYGSAGAQWLAQLSTVIEKCAQQWNLTDLIPYQNLTNNHVTVMYQISNMDPS